MTLPWYDVLGLVGVAMMIGAYAALQAGKMRSESLQFSLLNGVGSVLVLISLVFEFNLAAFIVEAFWLAISVYGLWRWNRARGRSA